MTSAATAAGTASSTSAKHPAASSSRVGNEARLLRRPSLRLEAAERGRRLRRQPDVPHHGDPGADDRPRAGDHGPGTLELDRIGPGLLDEADRVRERRLVGDLERAERHVGDDQRPRAPRVTARVSISISSIDAAPSVVPEHDHRRGVADEDELDAGRVGEAPARAS